MSQLIRKEGKARWVYRCDVCRVEFVEVDQLRILEARNRHLRPGLGHLGNALREALRPTTDILESIAAAFNLRQEDFELAPSSNPLHNPGLSLHEERIAYADDVAEGGEGVPEDYERHYCEEDGEDWPCSTVQAVTVVMDGEARHAREAVR